MGQAAPQRTIEANEFILKDGGGATRGKRLVRKTLPPMGSDGTSDRMCVPSRPLLEMKYKRTLFIDP
jgi:hypothetical protein